MRLDRALELAKNALIEQLLKAQGGMLEAFYDALGEHALYVIADMPGNINMVAANGSGGERELPEHLCEIILRPS